MRVASLILASAAATQAYEFSDVTQSLRRGLAGLLVRRDNKCPSVWKTVSSELTTKFLTRGQCNDAARAAIRMIFHDCGAWDTSLGQTNGCDGSLQFELGRGENGGLTPITTDAVALAKKYSVGVADMIVFMGNHATVTCPGGPVVKTFVGRKDATAGGVGGRLPDVNAPAADLFALFQAKGFNAVDLAALLGAHSTSTQQGVDPSQAGVPQDSTKGIWDVKYYAETYSKPSGVFVFPSDDKLSVHPTVGKEFKGFVGNQGKWTGKYADAMGRMSLFGNNVNNLIDCTNSLPSSTNTKRGIKAAGLMERAV